MKKLFSVLVIGSVLTLLIAGTARAQLPGTVIRASIPFDFIVRGRTLPAGRYEITRITDEPIGLMIRSLDHKHDEAVFETEPVYFRNTTRKDELVFHRYGDSTFLSEIVTAGEETGEELAPSHAERKLQREVARNQVEPETVTVAWN
jgi:hypothetical protein